MRRSPVLAILIICILLVLLGIAASAHVRRRDAVRIAREVTGGGEPIRGQAAIQRYGCRGCHTIPGVPGANALVGPPLNKFALRAFIAGRIPNTAPNLMHWIQHPHEIDEHTAMPEMGVTEQDSRDIAAYLYTLR